MKKLALIGTTLSAALLSSTVMATDFQALTVLQGTTPVALEDSELAATEGGAFCGVPISINESTIGPGGFAYCGEVGPYMSAKRMTKSGNTPTITVGGFFMIAQF
jgi:hypothetical protein